MEVSRLIMSDLKALHIETLLYELPFWWQKRTAYEEQLNVLLERQSNGDPNVTEKAVDSMIKHIHNADNQVHYKRAELERLLKSE